MAAKMVKLIAKTPKARQKLNDLFRSHEAWKGEWFVLDEECEEMLVAPAGHPWDKIGRWIHSTKDVNFTVCRQ